MRKISRISLIVFNIFLIVGIIFVIIGLDYYSRVIQELDLYPGLDYAMLLILTGAIIIILTVIGGIYFYLESPPKGLLTFTIFLIVGIIFLIEGLNWYSRLIQELDPYPELDLARLLILTGAIIIILSIISGIYFHLKSPPKLEVKKDYMNVKWLNHQYYELGRSLQDVASDQGVSMITVKKWVDKLEL